MQALNLALINDCGLVCGCDGCWVAIDCVCVSLDPKDPFLERSEGCKTWLSLGFWLGALSLTLTLLRVPWDRSRRSFVEVFSSSLFVVAYIGLYLYIREVELQSSFRALPLILGRRSRASIQYHWPRERR